MSKKKVISIITIASIAMIPIAGCSTSHTETAKSTTSTSTTDKKDEKAKSSKSASEDVSNADNKTESVNPKDLMTLIKFDKAPGKIGNINSFVELYNNSSDSVKQERKLRTDYNSILFPDQEFYVNVNGIKNFDNDKNIILAPQIFTEAVASGNIINTFSNVNMPMLFTEAINDPQTILSFMEKFTDSFPPESEAGKIIKNIIDSKGVLNQDQKEQIKNIIPFYVNSKGLLQVIKDGKLIQPYTNKDGIMIYGHDSFDTISTPIAVSYYHGDKDKLIYQLFFPYPFTMAGNKKDPNDIFKDKGNITPIYHQVKFVADVKTNHISEILPTGDENWYIIK